MIHKAATVTCQNRHFIMVKIGIYGLWHIILRVYNSHRLEKYLNIESFLEKSLKIKYALKSTGKSLKCLEKSLNSSIFCRN